MTDKGPPDDEEEETFVGDTSEPGPGATEGQFGGDLESLPGRRPAPPPRSEPTGRDFDLESLPGKPPAPPPRPAVPRPPEAEVPTREIDLEREMPTIVGSFAGSTPGAARPDAPASSEVPTKEIDVEREMPTVVGDFASASSAGATSPPDAEDEAATIVEGPAPPGSDAGTARSTPGTNAPARSASPGARPYKSPLSKGASRTARDPIVGTAAMRGTTPGGALTESRGLVEGQLLADRYELVERLGKGGMGEVWKAKHILLQGMRAIKVIKASISRDPAFRQRFLQEGQTMMRVKHPGVVEVTDLDETRSNRELFMVMEYLKGRTIFDAVRDREKPLAGDVRDAVRVLREIALGMQRIHDERIVHKDLKSDNVLLVTLEDGLEHPKVIDFGLAKRMGDKDETTEKAAAPAGTKDPDLHTTLSGTLAYMAPEQFRHEPSSFRSDVYAFGVMAYEVFTRGEYPLPRGPLAHYLDLHKKGTRPDAIAVKCPELDPALASILDRCMAVDKEARPESFKEVAADLKHWLETPERIARRKKYLYASAAAAALVAFGLWGVFFGGEKTASLSNLTLAAQGEPVPVAGKSAYLRAATLAPLELSADIKGVAGKPVLEIDGRAREIRSEVKGGRLVVTADLADLPDGPHSLALLASAGASPVTLTIGVDRTPPKVRGVAVKGAVVTPKAIFTNADQPEVVVDLGEPAAGIREVLAMGAAGARVGQRTEGADQWTIAGTSLGDGPAEIDVVVRDLAGNETRQRLAYSRDTKAPEASLADVFTCWPERSREAHRGLFVRQAAGSKLRVTVTEPCEVTVKFGDRAPVVREVAQKGEIEIDVPNVPEEGFATEVVVRDAARNETRIAVPLEVEQDVVRVMTPGSAPELAIAPDLLRPGESPMLVVARSYPMGEGSQLEYQAVLGPGGEPAGDTSIKPMTATVLRTTDEGKTFVWLIPPGQFADGTYRVTASVAGEARTVPLTLTVDSTAPELVAMTVSDAATGRAVPEGGYALGRDVRIAVEVEDLALQRIDLDGARPAQPVGPGRRRYEFSTALRDEGLNTLTLALRDAAGHTVEKAVNVLADWTDPQIVALDSPADGAQCDDTTNVVFSGRCSEPKYRLLVEGLPGGKTLEANCVTEAFAQPFLLSATEGPVALRVSAVDLAGRTSEPRVVRVNVVHRATELRPEIVWSRTVAATMEKVDPGDVVIGGRVRPVARVYVDRTEVTNRDYRAFLAATNGGRDAPRHPDEPKGWDRTPSAVTWGDPKWSSDDLPVVNVAYWDAWSFAKWSGRRLPTEAEWVKAAAKSKSADEAELRSWPPFGPGQEWKNGVVVTSEWAKGPLAAASGADVSPVGCLHMGGNVSEWVDLPADAGAAAAGTRGGSWFFSRRAADVRNTPAKAWDRSFRANTIGFRCAVDATQVEP